MANLQAFERGDYQQVKADLHRKILDRLDLEKLGRSTGNSAREEVLILIRSSVNSEAVPLSFAEREQLSREILDEIFGLGPLEPLLKDPTISDILVNRFDRVYVERAGKLEITGLSFKDNQHLMQIIDRIVSRIGRRVDESSPMVDARLQDGSRVNAIIPPLALDGACLSIRRFGRDPLTARNMIDNMTLTEPMLELLSAMVKGRLHLPADGGVLGQRAAPRLRTAQDRVQVRGHESRVQVAPRQVAFLRDRGGPRCLLAQRGHKIPVWAASDIGAEEAKLGMPGSPTQVDKGELVVLEGSESKVVHPTPDGIKALIQELMQEYIVG